jgi:hypothetical protein
MILLSNIICNVTLIFLIINSVNIKFILIVMFYVIKLIHVMYPDIVKPYVQIFDEVW